MAITQTSITTFIFLKRKKASDDTFLAHLQISLQKKGKLQLSKRKVYVKLLLTNLCEILEVFILKTLPEAMKIFNLKY